MEDERYERTGPTSRRALFSPRVVRLKAGLRRSGKPSSRRKRLCFKCSVLRSDLRVHPLFLTFGDADSRTHL